MQYHDAVLCMYRPALNSSRPSSSRKKTVKTQVEIDATWAPLNLAPDFKWVMSEHAGNLCSNLINDILQQDSALKVCATGKIDQNLLKQSFFIIFFFFLIRVCN